MNCNRFAFLLGMFLFVPPGLAQEKGIGDFPKLTNRDWPWWRGPTRNGISTSKTIPTKFSSTENVLWKADVPGRGHASPTVVGKFVLLATADETEKSQSVLAYDRKSGELLWQTELNRGGFPENNHPKNTEASPTIASDGQRLYASVFHHEGIHVTALDFTGKKVWEKKAGPFNPKRFEYGYAPSPLIYRDSVIIAAEHDGESYLTALKLTDGREKWRTPRPQNITFSSPVVGLVAGRDQLLISGSDKVASFDPNTGRPLWSVAGTTAATCGTLVWENDIVVASGGFPKAETIAVRGDRSQKVLWSNQQKCYEQSLLVHKGHVYALTDNGIAYCWRLTDGKEMWKERLAGPVSASPVLVQDRIYWANESGTHFVFRANPEKFELIAENQLGSEVFASPAIAGDQMFLRVAENLGGERKEFLYCIGENK